MKDKHHAPSYAKGYYEGSEQTRKQLEAEMQRRIDLAYQQGIAAATAEFAAMLAEVQFTVPASAPHSALSA